jgi:integrase
MLNEIDKNTVKTPWNKGKIIGQKHPLKASEVWSIRTILKQSGNKRDLALFNLAIDSKLRGCDLISLKRDDISHSNKVLARATVMQHKTGTPVKFEITEKTRDSLMDWFDEAEIGYNDYIFKSRIRRSTHITTRTYARIVQGWVDSIGLDEADYGTHSMRRTKVSLLYKMRGNLREIQILLGHKKI